MRSNTKHLHRRQQARVSWGVSLGLLFVCLAMGSPAYAQNVLGPATFNPSVPTAADPIQATFLLQGACIPTHQTIVTGNIVRTTVTLGNCIIGAPPLTTSDSTTFGPLPAGTYTYELYKDFNVGPQLVSTQQLVVAPSVPALSGSALAVLALTLGVIALFALRA